MADFCVCIQDILAWVVCAHRRLSLAELDALLTMRDPLGDRVIDLDTRLRERFGTLFTVHGTTSTADKTAEPRLSEDILKAIEQESFPDSISRGFAKPADNSDDIKSTQSVVERMKKIWVELGHTLIKEQIQQRDMKVEGTSFSANGMQAMMLEECLKNVCLLSSAFVADTISLARGYSAVYLTNHVLDVNIDDEEPDGRIRIASALVRLLMAEENTDCWVSTAFPYMQDDLLASNAVREKMRCWLRHIQPLQKFEQPTRGWLDEATQAPVGKMLKGVARSCARRWLTTVSTLDDILGFVVRYLRTVRRSMPGPCPSLRCCPLCDNWRLTQSFSTSANLKRRSKKSSALAQGQRSALPRRKSFAQQVGQAWSTTPFGCVAWRQH